MGSRLLDRGVATILDEATAPNPGAVLVVNPGRHTTRRIVEELSGREIDTEVRVLATEEVLKEVMEDFLIASKAADLIEADRLQLKSGAEQVENALVLTDTAIIALIKMDGTVAGLLTDDDTFVEGVSASYHDHWASAEDFRLRTPPIGRVRETLELEIGDDAEADFSTILESIETARGGTNGIDEVIISLIVAAKNEALLYDISKWGEDVGLASKATFSRTKTNLEEQGIIDTEKVPIDVGRPRLRLKLGDERLNAADSDELARVTMNLLA